VELTDVVLSDDPDAPLTTVNFVCDENPDPMQRRLIDLYVQSVVANPPAFGSIHNSATLSELN
jgi:hypothetical protein